MSWWKLLGKHCPSVQESHTQEGWSGGIFENLRHLALKFKSSPLKSYGWKMLEDYFPFGMVTVPGLC